MKRSVAALVGAIGILGTTMSDSAAESKMPIPVPKPELQDIAVLPDTLEPLFHQALHAMNTRSPELGSTRAVSTKSCTFNAQFGLDQSSQKYWAIMREVMSVREGVGKTKILIRTYSINSDGHIEPLNKYAFPDDESPIIFHSSQITTEAQLQKILQDVIKNCSLELRT